MAGSRAFFRGRIRAKGFKPKIMELETRGRGEGEAVILISMVPRSDTQPAPQEVNKKHLPDEATAQWYRL